MKIISRRVHGVLDYLLVVVFLSLPTALGLAGAPRYLSYSLAFAHLLVTGFTSFPPGAFPLIPARAHAVIEVVVGLLLVPAPWLLGFSRDSTARNAFILLGLLILALSAITNYDRRGEPVPRPPGDRRRWFPRKG